MDTKEKKIRGIWQKIRKWTEDRKSFLVTVGILYGLFAVVFLLLWGRKGSLPGIATPVPLNWLWLGAVGMYTLVSLRIVEADKRGLILLWGKPILETKQGLKLVPLKICILEIITRTRIQLELPGEPEQIWRMEDEKGNELPVGIGPNGQPVPPKTRIVDGLEVTLPWVPPWRITTAGKESCLLEVPFGPFRAEEPGTIDAKAHGKWVGARDAWEKAKSDYIEQEKEFREDMEKYAKKNDPLHERLTVESQLIVRFRIADFLQFIQVIHTVDEAKRQIEDTVAGRVQTEFARRTPALILAHLDAINRRLLEDVEILVGERVNVFAGEKRDPWGIKVEDVYVKLLGITKSVNEKIAARMGAGFLRYQLVLEGQGRGEGQEKELTATARGLMAVGKVAESPGGTRAVAAVYGTRMAENVGNLLITDSSILANTIGAIATGKGVLTEQPPARQPKKQRRRGGGSPPPPPPPASPGTPPASPSP